MKMNRILYFILKKIYITPIWFLRIWRYSLSTKYTLEEKYKMVKYVIHQVNKGCNVNIICTGVEKLPKESGYLLAPNHQGLFDTLLIADMHERPLSFVIKKEMANVILLKQVIRLLDAKTMDRDDVRQSMQVIGEVAKALGEGKNYIIFPEGTRSRGENPNQPGVFKSGAFKSAVKVKAPIVPIALVDSYKPFDIKSTKPVDVQIHFLDPMYYEEYKDMKTTEISEIVRTRIVNKISEITGQEIK